MASNPEWNRRRFIKGAAVLGAAPLIRGGSMAQPQPAQSQQVPEGQVPKKSLGRTGVQVSAMGLGGYHLGSAETDQAANEIVAKAFDHGVTFFDNAWEYHDGLSEERLGKALRGKRDQAFVMTKVCTHGRDKKIAMRMLEESLRRLQTDHLDLWQIHEVVYDNDPDLIFAPNGAAEALLAAKQQGKVRFVGFTGHKDPEIHLKMLSHDFPFDTVQMPLNCCDATFRSFETHVLPEATGRGIAVLGMKSLGGSGELVHHGAVTAEQGLRYAMSLPVASTISGVDSMQVLDQNLRVAVNFQPLASAEMQALRDQCRFLASDGRLELFKMTTMYDGKVGREQHHLPTSQELPI
ncbi:MAG TPA: aldo/keto reductase [Candidatus Acidoferrales bacterium]|nr:aldo/keto reductase [Candidatus Acidoferrales bacterium]